MCICCVLLFIENKKKKASLILKMIVLHPYIVLFARLFEPSMS